MALDALTPLPVEEVLHGVTVADPYRWLEDRDSSQTVDWIAGQKRRLDGYFSSFKELTALRTRVSHFLNVDVIDQATHVGNLCFYRRRERNHEQGRIWVKNMTTAEERVLFGPNEQARFVSAAIHCISGDGSLLAYEVKCGGEDTRAIHVVEVGSGRTLTEHLDTGYARGFAFDSDNTGFYYCHEPAGATEDHMIRLRRFGRVTEQDEVVLRMTHTPGSRLVLMSDDFHLGAAYIHDHGSDVASDFYLASRSQDQEWTCVFANRVPPCLPLLRHERILMLTSDGAPNGRIVELSNKGIMSRVIVPESESRIQQLSIAGENIYVSYVIRGETVVRVYSLSGKYLESLNTLGKGSVRLFPGYGNRSDTLFYSYESFTDPATIFQYQPETGKSEVWARTSISLDRTHIRRITYLSKDGIEIPMTLVVRKDVESSNERPAILTSYGGFGVSMTPQFSVLVAIMLELGAMFAVPNIRGGSEFGTGWHEAARKRNRQVAIDDFISAAEWLCAQHVTSPHRLAIFGGSNSGLLVGAAMTQRPDLFRAALCIAPLLDMVRYERFGHARKWNTEYGTVTDPADFHALYAYSPYHHVENDLNYPSTLFVAGDKDDRCDPAHVRKMAARLQDRIAQQNPILVDYSRERGHSPVLPLSVRIEALTRRVAFLCQELNIPLPLGDSL
jgi:prolyl oligopeptidase